MVQLGMSAFQGFVDLDMVPPVQIDVRKGDLDAAIDRFLDATQVRPNYALPFRLLAEAQDKRGRKKDAVESYTHYLEIYPQAEDAGKVRKRIDKLQQELDKTRRKSR